MTPKEKAEEIYLNYAKVFEIRNLEINKYVIIVCALIAVDEIIKNGGTKFIIEYQKNSFTNGVSYWQEVKQEIEKL